MNFVARTESAEPNTTGFARTCTIVLARTVIFMEKEKRMDQRRTHEYNVYNVYISVALMASDADDVQISGCIRGFLL